MKTVAISILCLASVALADDFKTIDGKQYKNVSINRIEPDGIVVNASYGIIKIPFAELPPNVQQKYHYDPVASADFRQRLDKAAAARDRHIAEVEHQRQLEQAAAMAVSTAAPTTTVAPAQLAPTQPEASGGPIDSTGALSRGTYGKSTTAEQILFDYWSNSIEADSKYKGQRYTVGGKIKSITSENGSGLVTIAIYFKDPNFAVSKDYSNRSARSASSGAGSSYYVLAYFPNPSVLVGRRVGSQIALNGVIEGIRGHHLIFRDCSLPR